MRALITSGGGAKGAFTVGALKYLQENGISQYDFISGTSTGSLIAAMVALGRFTTLVEVYTSVTNNSILNKQNLVRNFLEGKPYLFDTLPLLDLIRLHIKPADFTLLQNSPATVCFTSVSLQTGRTTVFSTKPLASQARYDIRIIDSYEKLVLAMLASSSQAGFLKPVIIDGEQFVDGGNRDVIPAQVVVDHHPDEVYLISNNPRHMVRTDKQFTNVVDVILRAITTFIQEIREDDIASLLRYGQREGKKIYIIEPTEDHDLDPQNPTGLRFDRILMNNWVGEGRIRAKEIVFSNPVLL